MYVIAVMASCFIDYFPKPKFFFHLFVRLVIWMAKFFFFFLYACRFFFFIFVLAYLMSNL